MHLTLTAQGLLAIDINVTGRIASHLWGHENYLPVIVEEDVSAALNKSFAFARDFFGIRDPYKRYDRLLYNIALHGCQQRMLVAKLPSGGSFTLPMRHPDPDSVIAFDRLRLITREDLVRPDQEIPATLALLRRRLEPPY